MLSSRDSVSSTGNSRSCADTQSIYGDHSTCRCRYWRSLLNCAQSYVWRRWMVSSSTPSSLSFFSSASFQRSHFSPLWLCCKPRLFPPINLKFWKIQIVGAAACRYVSLTMTFFCRHEKSAPAKRRMRIIRLFYQKKKIKENYRRKLSNEKGDLLCNEHFSTPIFTIIITIVLFKYPPSSIILFFWHITYYWLNKVAYNFCEPQQKNPYPHSYDRIFQYKKYVFQTYTRLMHGLLQIKTLLPFSFHCP